MDWWYLRGLRSAKPADRIQAIQKLSARQLSARTVEALRTTPRDRDENVRLAGVLALAQVDSE
jgi:hypothetical protein